MTRVRWRFVVSLFVLHMLWDSDFAFGYQLDTPVDFVGHRSISETKLGPVSYKPSLEEKPFFDRLEAKVGGTLRW
jgi:hypothetical protein